MLLVFCDFSFTRAEELKNVVGLDTTIKRRVASFEISGNHTTSVSNWLLRCGF